MYPDPFPVPALGNSALHLPLAKEVRTVHTHPSGKIALTVLAADAEFERELIWEQQR